MTVPSIILGASTLCLFIKVASHFQFVIQQASYSTIMHATSQTSCTPSKDVHACVPHAPMCNNHCYIMKPQPSVRLDS